MLHTIIRCLGELLRGLSEILQTGLIDNMMKSTNEMGLENGEERDTSEYNNVPVVVELGHHPGRWPSPLPAVHPEA